MNGIRLVVAQADVEERPVLADEALLGEQGLGLRLGGDEVHLGDLGDHVERAAGPPGFEKWPATRLRIDAPCRRR